MLETSQSKVRTEAESPRTPTNIQEPKHTYTPLQGTQAQCQAPPMELLADIFCVPRVASASGWPLTLWSQGQLHPEGAFALPTSPISLQSTILMS